MALEMLFRTNSYREGIWDSMLVGMVTGSLVAVEEEWSDENGVIPEDRQASFLRIDNFLRERKVTIILTQRAGTTMSKMRWRELSENLGGGRTNRTFLELNQVVDLIVWKPPK